MSRLTKELIDDGYLTMLRNPNDSRQNILALSEKGKEFIEYLNTSRFDLEERLYKVIGIERFDHLNLSIQELLSFMETRLKDL